MLAAIALAPDLIINFIRFLRNEALFYLSKILSIFTQPLIWAAVLFGLSLLLWGRSRHRAAAGIMLAALGWTALVGWLPLPEALLRELENRHPAPVEVVAGQIAGLHRRGGAGWLT